MIYPYTVGCSQPAPPTNGFVLQTSNLTILFGCNEGYTPFRNMTDNCIAMNLWSSVPAEHQCTKVVTGKFFTSIYFARKVHVHIE